jgi:DNA replication protein DnaC
VKLDRMIFELGSGSTWLLCGPRGTGKTQMGVILCAAALLLHGRVRYVVAQEMFVQMRSAFDGPTTLTAELRAFASPHLLVADDLHCRQHTDWEHETLNYLIDKRYAAMRDTLLITNETEDKALERIGPSITDRMRESGGILVCDWASYRGRDIT